MAYQIWDSCIFVPGFSRGECASWVQAIGSVLAILAAVLVARHQSKRMERVLRDEECRRVESKFAPAIAIIETAIKEMRTGYDEALAARVNSAFGVGPEFTERHRWYAESFSKIEVHTLPTAQSARLILRLQALFREADEVMDNTAFRLNQLHEITPEHRVEFDQVLHGLESCLSLLRHEIGMLAIVTKPRARVRELAFPRK